MLEDQVAEGEICARVGDARERRAVSEHPANILKLTQIFFRLALHLRRNVQRVHVRELAGEDSRHSSSAATDFDHGFVARAEIHRGQNGRHEAMVIFLP